MPDDDVAWIALAVVLLGLSVWMFGGVKKADEPIDGIVTDSDNSNKLSGRNVFSSVYVGRHSEFPSSASETNNFFIHYPETVTSEDGTVFYRVSGDNSILGDNGIYIGNDNALVESQRENDPAGH